MFKARGKLLIVLVLVAASLTATWTAVHARSREGATKYRSRSYSSVGVSVSSRPGARPASGEPDTPNKVPPPGHLVLGENGDGMFGPGGLPGLSRVWITRFLGMR
jgi:hypothetical protein